MMTERQDAMPAEGQLKEDKPRFDWLSALQLGLGALGALGLMGLSALMGVGMGMSLIVEGEVELLPATLASAAALLFMGLMAAISAGYAGWRLLRPEGSAPELPSWTRRILNPYLWALLIPLVWLAAWATPKSGWAAALLFPLVNIAGIGLPLWLVVTLARRGLPTGSAQRQWGLFTAGMILATLPILLLEMLAGAMLAAVVLVLNPGLMQALVEIVESGRNLDVFELEGLLMTYLHEGEVLAYAGLFIAGVVPFIEELFKPLGVWLLAGRKLTPAAGFAAGAISGMGFAMFESLLGSAEPTLWPDAMLVRAAPGVMHILATGISGWGLAQAFTHQRYGRAVLSYLTAVGLHAAWNGVPVLLGAVVLAGEANGGGFDLAQLETAATGVFAIMGLAALAVLVYINRRLAGGIEAGAPKGEEAAAGTTNQE